MPSATRKAQHGPDEDREQDPEQEHLGNENAEAAEQQDQ